MPVGQYLIYAVQMIKDWSLDRFPKPNQKLESLFMRFPTIQRLRWLINSLAYNYLFENGETSIRKQKYVYLYLKWT